MESNVIDISTYLVNFFIFDLGFVLFSIGLYVLIEAYKNLKD